MMKTMNALAVVAVAANLGMGATLTIAAATAEAVAGQLQQRLPEGWSIISNPLDRGDNQLDTVLPLPDAALGATLLRFDVATQAYGPPITWMGTEFGWQTTSENPEWTVLAPGEGAFILCLAPLEITWMGERGIHPVVIPGNGLLALIAPPIPETADLQTLGLGLGLVPEEPDLGMTVTLFDSDTQAFKQPYQYFPGLGWLSLNPDDEGPGGPTIPAGSGFFVQNPGRPSPRLWDPGIINLDAHVSIR